MAILPPAIIAGCRDMSMGTDTASYPYSTYLTCSHSHTIHRAFQYVDMDLESLYVVVAYISSKIYSDFSFFLFTSHFLLLSSLSFAFYRSKIEIWEGMMLFYLLFYAVSLNAARQFIAIPFCALSLIEYAKGNKINCFIAMIIAYGFHHSSLFFIVILLLYYMCRHHANLMYNKTTMLSIMIVVMGVIFLFNKLLLSIVGLGLTDMKYLNRYGGDAVYGTNVPISLFAFNIFTFLMLLLMTRNKGKSNNLFFLYNAALGIFFCFTGLISTFTVRLCFYCMIISIVGTVHLLKKNSKLHTLTVFGFYLFYWFMTVVMANLEDTYPYKSIILSTII